MNGIFPQCHLSQPTQHLYFEVLFALAKFPHQNQNNSNEKYANFQKLPMIDLQFFPSLGSLVSFLKWS